MQSTIKTLIFTSPLATHNSTKILCLICLVALPWVVTSQEREKEWRIHEKKVLSSDPHGDPPPVLPREETSREDLSNPINVEEKKDVEPDGESLALIFPYF